MAKIEQALVDCDLMFVWMTPESAKSNWIPFESGYAYAKGIDVVPIGCLGMTLNSLPAPISSLQGFDATSSSGLNNIITKINEKFNLSIQDGFDDKFYTEKFQANSMAYSPQVLRFVDTVEIRFPHQIMGHSIGEVHPIGPNPLSVLAKVLKEAEDKCSIDTHQIVGLGFSASVVTPGHDTDEWIESRSLAVAVDPIALNRTMPIWARIAGRLYGIPMRYIHLTPKLTNCWSINTDPALIASRLDGSEVDFETESPYRTFRFHNLFFHFNNEWDAGLHIFIPIDNEEPIPLYPLLELLEERRILEPSN